jgi:hypothetical protein
MPLSPFRVVLPSAWMDEVLITAPPAGMCGTAALVSQNIA